MNFCFEFGKSELFVREEVGLKSENISLVSGIQWEDFILDDCEIYSLKSPFKIGLENFIFRLCHLIPFYLHLSSSLDTRRISEQLVCAVDIFKWRNAAWLLIMYLLPSFGRFWCSRKYMCVYSWKIAIFRFFEKFRLSIVVLFRFQQIHLSPALLISGSLYIKYFHITGTTWWCWYWTPKTL